MLINARPLEFATDHRMSIRYYYTSSSLCIAYIRVFNHSPCLGQLESTELICWALCLIVNERKDVGNGTDKSKFDHRWETKLSQDSQEARRVGYTVHCKTHILQKEARYVLLINAKCTVDSKLNYKIRQTYD
jgi:hypothetical protein